MRYRFFAPQSFDHRMAVRFCNIDYDREIAITAFVDEDHATKMTGVGRLIIEPDEETLSSEWRSQTAGRGMESAANCLI